MFFGEIRFLQKKLTFFQLFTKKIYVSSTNISDGLLLVIDSDFLILPLYSLKPSTYIQWTQHEPAQTEVGHLRAGDVTYGKNKNSIMGIWLSSILSVLFKPK